MKPIIQVENLSKLYEIGTPHSKSLKESAERWWRRLQGKPILYPSQNIPYGFSKNQEGPRPNTFWALKDISFEVQQGEVVGIIGRNGAGKSTLLKILSRITEPTSGRAIMRGRVASLLEVGTGFHPDLTGSENIYLNGAILGMRKWEIDRKFDEIVAFAEIEKFIDTPVKHYSSGMYVRLAFAVAAHLDPEILIVDEVLAVGDAEFQKKCLGKMSEVAKLGRTVLFVSHNMTALKALCKRAIQIKGGCVSLDGEVAPIINDYMNSGVEKAGFWEAESLAMAPGSERVKVQALKIITQGKCASQVMINERVSIEIDFYVLEDGLKKVCPNIYLLDSFGGVVLSTASTSAANAIQEEWFSKAHPRGLYRARCEIPANFLNEGYYYITLYMVTLGPISVHATLDRVVSLTVIDDGNMRESGSGKDWAGNVRVRLPWYTEYVAEEGNSK